jgi:hypothetical protein
MEAFLRAVVILQVVDLCQPAQSVYSTEGFERPRFVSTEGLGQYFSDQSSSFVSRPQKCRMITEMKIHIMYTFTYFFVNLRQYSDYCGSYLEIVSMVL